MFLNAREDQLETMLRNYGPYVNILGNVIGSGPWFDAYVPNMLVPGRSRCRVRTGDHPMTLDASKVKLVALIQVVALVVIGLFFLLRGSDERTLTAHFDRAIAVYPGTDLRVMGVQIGKVTPSSQRATACASR